MKNSTKIQGGVTSDLKLCCFYSLYCISTLGEIFKAAGGICIPLKLIGFVCPNPWSSFTKSLLLCSIEVCTLLGQGIANFDRRFLVFKEFTAFRKERGNMLLSRKNQLLLEFSFWNEPVPREGPNIYELRSYQLRVSVTHFSLFSVVHSK